MAIPDLAQFKPGPDPLPGQIAAALIDRKTTLKKFFGKDSNPVVEAGTPRYPRLIPSQELVIQGMFQVLLRRAKE